MTIFLTIVALDFAPVSRLWTITDEMTPGLSVIINGAVKFRGTNICSQLRQVMFAGFFSSEHSLLMCPSLLIKVSLKSLREEYQSYPQLRQVSGTGQSLLKWPAIQL